LEEDEVLNPDLEACLNDRDCNKYYEEHNGPEDPEDVESRRINY